MAHICFLTFYDQICIGPRLLSSILKKNGHKTNLVIFKGEKYDKIISEQRKDLQCYSYFREGFFRGSLFDIDKWTKDDEDALIRLLQDISPDILAITTRSFWADLGKHLSYRIRDTFPNIPIVAGGWGPSLEPEKFLEYCDYVFFGEGDNVIVDIANNCDAKKDFRNLKNVIYKDKKNIIRNKAYESVKDLDSLPFPDFEPQGKYLITEGKIKKGIEFYNSNMYDVFIGRGCPLDCSYCMSSKWHKLYREIYEISYRKQSWRSVDRVLEEIELAKEKGAKFIRFRDEVFPLEKQWIEDFIPKYKKKINLPFFGYLRPEFHDEKTIRRLCEAGLCSTAVGIQSGSEYMRREIYNRQFKKENLLKFAHTIKALNLKFEYHLIAFCPIEEEKHMEETLQFLYTLPPGPLKVFKIVSFPKAPLTELIGDRQQDEKKDRLDNWYARLYTMALKEEPWKELAKGIHKTNMFKESPEILSHLFVKELQREKKLLRAQYKKFHTRSFTISEEIVRERGQNESIR